MPRSVLGSADERAVLVPNIVRSVDESLTGFLSGYLHQDWDLEYADAGEAAAGFARTERVTRVRRTMAEITQLVDSRMSEDDLSAWLQSVGCYYLPVGSVRQWLADLGQVMAVEITRR